MNTFAGKKVFVLDKSATLIFALKTELEARKFEVQTATDSVAALMPIIHWHPDLLITGVEVGQLKGDDLCLLFNLMSDYAGIPIVVMTSSSDEKVQKKICDAGADFYVMKGSRLIESIVAILNKVFPPAIPLPEESPRQPAIRRVLVVDDSKVMRRVIGNILTSIGIQEIVEADNGLNALKRLQECPVDLLVTDWNMPVMTGIELVRKVRADARYDKVKIVMVTTEGGKNEVAEAKNAGVCDLLQKPFSKEKMKEMIARLMTADKASGR